MLPPNQVRGSNRNLRNVNLFESFTIDDGLTVFILGWKEKEVPKLKTNRGAAKRFKKTGTGRVKVKRAFARHILTSKSASRKRHMRTPKHLEKADEKAIKKLIPYL